MPERAEQVRVMLNETRSGSLSAKTCFFPNVNMLFLIDLIVNIMDIPQTSIPPDSTS